MKLRAHSQCQCCGMGICMVICTGMACMVYLYTWLVCIVDVPAAKFGCELCGAYAAAAGAIGQEFVAVCSVCAGIICVDVIKRRVSCRYGVYNSGCRVQGAWCMGAARAAIYSSYRVRSCFYAFMLEFARGMAYSIRRVDSHYGPIMAPLQPHYGPITAPGPAGPPLYLAARTSRP